MEALEHYRNQPTPPLIIVESTEHAQHLLSGLDRLAEVCDPGTKVVVIGSHNDIGLYRELMRRGVSEYLVPPLQTLQLIRAVTTLYTDPAVPFVGRTMAFRGRQGRRRLLNHRPQRRLSALRSDAGQHGDRRLRPAVRHRRAWISTRTRCRA